MSSSHLAPPIGVYFGSGVSGVGGLAGGFAAAEPVGLGAGLQDVGVEGDPVDDGGDRAGVGEDGAPLLNGRFVPIAIEALSSRSVMIWNRSSAPRGVDLMPARGDHLLSVLPSRRASSCSPPKMYQNVAGLLRARPQRTRRAAGNCPTRHSGRARAELMRSSPPRWMRAYRCATSRKLPPAFGRLLGRKLARPRGSHRLCGSRRWPPRAGVGYRGYACYQATCRG